ncbi:redoxin domain-containing protein [Marivirga sp. S37H4]|uniref:thioredoxin-dependent peroxiredoxin n=1 Tax=Marivirga aurantiaca TaxID=2802615 RepID=A0A934WVU0_9BACT|nr:redoxin domain-containing protein [Marivirga aurantiaca]MBK6263850.1 redoxin domain-containing protein [Marivirga aurantiaca]
MSIIIKVGDNAPAIHATDVWGNNISVPSNDKWIYLSFHRFAACPYCNLRTNELIRHYERFKKLNIEVVSIWPSDKDNLLRHAGSEKTPFPMLSDKNKSIYKAYGVTESSFMGGMRLLLHPQLMLNAIRNKHKNIEIDADPKLMPASFLVDPNGIIQLAYYGKHFGDHPKIELILQQLKGL